MRSEAMGAGRVRELDAASISPARFRDEIVPAGRPVVFRGLVADWPAVRAGRESPAALADYLKRHDSGATVPVKVAPPESGGRFFYDDDLAGFNFRREQMTVTAALDAMLAPADAARPVAMAVQSARARRVLPGFARANRMALLPADVAPRFWLGTAVTVAAHFDPSENIAAVVAGRRRFTLFAPDQAGNLYPGPFELTPGGQIVSMVDFDAPDGDRFPRFADAMATALVADMGPGDALYVPYLWWHHVRSTEPVNMLVNYWWNPPSPSHGTGIDALLLAMLAIKDLPEQHRAAWRSLFDHFAFGRNGPPGTHLPIGRRGVQGEMTDTAANAYLAALARGITPK